MYQSSPWYTLNLNSVTCQLYLNLKKKKGGREYRETCSDYKHSNKQIEIIRLKRIIEIKNPVDQFNKLEQKRLGKGKLGQ